MWNIVRNKNTVTKILHSWPPHLPQHLLPHPRPSCFMSARSIFSTLLYLIFPYLRALVDFTLFLCLLSYTWDLGNDGSGREQWWSVKPILRIEQWGFIRTQWVLFAMQIPLGVTERWIHYLSSWKKLQRTYSREGIQNLGDCMYWLTWIFLVYTCCSIFHPG